MKVNIILLTVSLLIQSQTQVDSLSPPPEIIDHTHATAILSKKRVNLQDHTDKSIRIASPDDGDFLSFIRQSSLWVDKSLLINKVQEPGRKETQYRFATAPPKWGKTINLSMVKFFFELPVDENGFETPRNQSAAYLYFNEGKVLLENGTVEELDGIPLISKHNLSCLADHPVIYIKGENYTDNEESMRVMVHQTYRRHESFLNRLLIQQREAKPNSTDHRFISQDIEDFRTYYDWDRIKNNVNQLQLQQGIKILDRLLSHTYRSPAVILYDDYDHYLYNSIFNIDTINSSDPEGPRRFWNSFYQDFLISTFPRKEYKTIGFISGVLSANFPTLRVNFLHDHAMYIDFIDLFPFYGIFENEFQQMASKRGIDRNTIDNATQWYGGYRSLSNLHTQMYRTHSVAQFISTLQIRSYWTDSVISLYLKQLFRNPEIHNDALFLIDSLDGNKIGMEIKYEHFSQFKLADYLMMPQLLLSQVSYNQTQELRFAYVRHRNLVFSVALFVGYAAVHLNQSRVDFAKMDSSDISLTLPNREVYEELREFHTKVGLDFIAQQIIDEVTTTTVKARVYSFDF